MSFTLRRRLWHLLDAIRREERELDDVVEEIIAIMRKGVMPPPPDQTGTPLPGPPS